MVKKKKVTKKKPQSRTPKHLLKYVIDNAFLAKVSTGSPRSEKVDHTIIVSDKKISDILKLPAFKKILAWQKTKLSESKDPVIQIDGSKGRLWIVQLGLFQRLESGTQAGAIDESEYGISRDVAGEVWSKMGLRSGEKVVVHFAGCKTEEKTGFIVGLANAQYRFKLHLQERKVSQDFYITGMNASQLEEAKHLATATMVGRHLVNLPAEDLNPKSYADTARAVFSKQSGFSVSVLEEAQIKKLGMGMLWAVGRAAEHKPRLVHLKYRPRSSSKAPVAFVGKGITFDSGGLDLKPPSAMRLMKKDMGGSAAVFALAYYVSQAKPHKAFDFYLPLAENCADGLSFRPGDILKASNGKTVEIDNTDAEGRLVLGDAMIYATSQKEKPRILVDVATLTGAIKVALGAEIPGLFSNSDALAQKLLDAGQKMGEPVWRMPVVNRYMRYMRSQVADMVNSAATRFGGAITAALFLQEFNNDVPWAHMDIYSWSDGPSGSQLEPGGSGQAVQMLSEFVKKV